MKKKILVICTGNTCRSQMAEGFLNHLNNSIEVYSAGTHAELYINPFAVKAMSEAGIDISNQYTKNVDNFLHHSFDYLITLCDNAKEKCPNFTGEIKNRIHISIPDPSNSNGNEDEKLNVYRNVRDIIEDKIKDFYYSEIESKMKSA